MRILPLIILNGFKIYENSIKYFLIQSIASILFLISLLLVQFYYNGPIEVIILLTIFVKLGAAPFHGWYVSLLKTMSINILFLLSTVQKFIPCLIISIVLTHSYLILGIIIINTLYTVFNRLLVLRLNHILAYSSINNINWIIISVGINLQLFTLFILFYIVIIIGLILYNWNPYVRTFIQINMSQSYDKLFLLFLLLSLGGLPPFIGFISKLIILKRILSVTNLIFTTILIYSSIIVLIMYTYYRFLAVNFTPNSHNILQFKYTSFIKILYFLTITSLPLTMLLIL